MQTTCGRENSRPYSNPARYDCYCGTSAAKTPTVSIDTLPHSRDVDLSRPPRLMVYINALPVALAGSAICLIPADAKIRVPTANQHVTTVIAARPPQKRRRFAKCRRHDVMVNPVRREHRDRVQGSQSPPRRVAERRCYISCRIRYEINIFVSKIYVVYLHINPCNV